MKTINLPSRYRDVETTLTQTSANEWKFETTGLSMRSGYDNKTGEITMIDPEGGPFIESGFQFDGNTVDHIEKREDGFHLITTPTQEKGGAE